MNAAIKPKPPVVPLVPVKSSMVSHTGYDPITRTLAVQFSRGKTYHYSNVPPEVYEKMGKAESIGKFIGSNLRGKFDAVALEQ